MADLFNRRAVLVIGRPQAKDDFKLETPNALRVENLRIDFSIEKDDKPKPNKSTIQVYNLTPEHRGQLKEKGIRILLQAGYDETLAQIFSGDARFINSQKTGPDWITKFECGDGERSYTFARVSESFNAGTPIKTVISSLTNALQLDPGNAMEAATKLSRTFPNGYVIHGLASVELTRLLKAAHLDWSIQDGRIEVLGIKDTVTNEVPLISAKTGMVGSPEFGSGEKKKGESFLKVKTLLNPGIRPGQKFKVESRNQTGFFKCRKVKHDGSTFGGAWYSEIEAIHV